jgi:uncharacterized protein
MPEMVSSNFISEAVHAGLIYTGRKIRKKHSRYSEVTQDKWGRGSYLLFRGRLPDMYRDRRYELDKEVGMHDPEGFDQPEDSRETVPDETSPEAAIPSCIHFHLQGAGNQLLVASVEPSLDFPAGIGPSKIEEWIRNQGCGDWLACDEAILQLAREIRRLEHPKEYIVAERRDCQIEVQVSPDRLKAWIRIVPAFGGEAPNETSIGQALADQHVCFGINKEFIQQIIQEGSCERVLIAEGITPAQGAPAGFEPLVKESEHKGVPQEKENGRVDYKDLGLFISVEKGTPLLKRIPPTAGTSGNGVDGKPIAAPAGKDRALIPGIGTAISKEDPNLVIATRIGQPSYYENSVRVDPTLEVDTVDPSTGNVIFDGNILVRGSVESGFMVKAGQDLTILDTVEGANLTAGKNLLLLTGIYGKNKSEVVAGGNIEARFLSDCRVRCGGNLDVSDLIAHCYVECEGALVLGKRGGKGQAFGGKLVALKGVQAEILGSMSESATVVEVAPSRSLLAQQARADAAMEKVRRDLEFVGKKLKALESAGGEGSNSHDLQARFSVLSEKLEELQDEQERIQKKLAAFDKAKIKAAQAHRGVTLSVGSVRLAVNELTNDVCLQQPVEQKHPQ